MADDFESFEEEILEIELDTEVCLRQAYDLVAGARRVPVSASVMVDREQLLDLIQGAIDRIPEEVKESKLLLRDREEIVAQGRRQADVLLDDVRARAEQMVQRTEVVRQANQVSQRILDEAREEARRMQRESEDFCDQKLASFEIVLDRTSKTVQAGREKLRSSPAPTSPPVGDGGIGGTDEEIEAFFDQDQ